jgi:hypothetical protein
MKKYLVPLWSPRSIVPHLYLRSKSEFPPTAFRYSWMSIKYIVTQQSRTEAQMKSTPTCVTETNDKQCIEVELNVMKGLMRMTIGYKECMRRIGPKNICVYIPM